MLMIVEFLIIFFISIALTYIAYRTLVANDNRFIPLLFLLGSIALVHFYVPILQSFFEYYRYQDFYRQETKVFAYIFSFLIFFSLLVSYVFVIAYIKKLPSSVYSRGSPLSSLKTVYWFLLIVGIPSLFAIFYNLSVIFSVGIEYYMKNRIFFGTGSGLIKLAPSFLSIGLMMLFSQLIWGKKSFFSNKRHWMIFVIVNLFLMSYFLLTGSRNSVFVLLLNYIICYLFLADKKSNQLTKVVVCSILGVFIFSYLGYERKDVLGYELEDKSSGEMLVEGVNGAFGNHENLLWLIEHDFADYQYGGTYFAGVMNFVPRALWSEKPVGGGPVLVNQIYPGSYSVGEKSVSSLTPGAFTEGYLNFGVLFAPFVVIFYSLILIFQVWTIRYIRDPVTLAFYTYFVSVANISLIYGEFLGVFTRGALVLIGTFLIVHLVNRLTRK